MQKLTLSIEDDLYDMLQRQVGRGSIGRFISEAIRPKLKKEVQDGAASAFGMLSHLAKPVTSADVAKAKQRYLAQRYAAKNGQ